MKKLNAMIIIGLVINTLLSILYAGGSRDGEVIMIILAVPLGVSYIGVLMVLADKLVWGYRFIMIGSALFAPIGLIAIFGVIKLRKTNEGINFNKRETEIAEQQTADLVK